LKMNTKGFREVCIAAEKNWTDKPYASEIEAEKDAVEMARSMCLTSYVIETVEHTTETSAGIVTWFSVLLNHNPITSIVVPDWAVQG
jgi:hypothetical protein